MQFETAYFLQVAIHLHPSHPLPKIIHTCFFALVRLLSTIILTSRPIQNSLKLINNSSRENKENHYRDRGFDM